MKYILSIDVGTSNVRAIIIDGNGTLQGICQTPLHTLHGQKGHTEMNPEEIVNATKTVVDKVVCIAAIPLSQIDSIGIANARESTIVWDKTTGKAVWNTILWHDTRSNDFCTKNKDHENDIQEKTGLPLTSYGSATKISWILKNAKIKNKENLLFGNIGTWLLWKLSAGRIHKTDITNASRTLLFNIHTKKWDDSLLSFFGVDRKMLPEVVSCSEFYGLTDKDIFGCETKVCAMIGDAQSGLFAAGCHESGDLHCSLGTGAFLLCHSGTSPYKGNKGLISTIAMQRKGEDPTYCIEAAALSTGSVIEWLKNHMGIIRSAKEIEGLAYSVPDSLGVFFVPLIHGGSSIGKSEHTRGSFLGLSSATNIGHLCRATLEGISHMICSAYEKIKVAEPNLSLKCSGGMSENLFLMQMLSDLLNSKVARSKSLELSAFGAAYLAGLCTGVWKDEKEIRSLFSADRCFSPKLSDVNRQEMKQNWKRAIAATTLFSEEAR